MPETRTVLLLLIRHGEAGHAALDAERELTQRGRETLRRLGAQLVLNEFIPDAIRSSPLVRALQTAEILQGALGSEISMDATTDLAAGATAAGLAALLKDEPPGTTVIWVGHMPDLGRFAADLLGQNGGVDFRPGGCMAVEVDGSAEPPQAVKRWEWTP